MLSSMVSTASSTLSTTSAAASTFTNIGISEISIITVVCLIALLSASEVLSATRLWNRRVSTMFNLAIAPMVMTFFLIVGYKVIDIIGN